MPAAARIPDVINVNIWWTVWSGNRACAYSVGTVQQADRYLARQAARALFPEIRSLFVEEMFG